MGKKKDSRRWYLHFTYVDNYGMQHSVKYLMPRDFQKSVTCVFTDKKFCKEFGIKLPYLAFEE